MPAEWEPHRATWIAWPHHEPDWPGKLAAIPWVYAEIVRILASHEQVEILCHDEGVLGDAQTALDAHGVPASRVRCHVVPTDRVWLRDSAPSATLDEDGRVVLVNWAFNGWAKYDNWTRDADVGRRFQLDHQKPANLTQFGSPVWDHSVWKGRVLVAAIRWKSFGHPNAAVCGAQEPLSNSRVDRAKCLAAAKRPDGRTNRLAMRDDPRLA